METKGNINKSSLIDLKAELYRKQEEFKKQKVAGGNYIKGKTQEKQKPDLFSKKNKGVLERAQRDYVEKVEEEDVHAKSRRALEAKAKLYDKISSSSTIPEEDGSGLYLVDFQKKVIENIVAERDREQDEEPRVAGCAPRDEELDTPLLPPPSDPQEEWVDYVDSLGRSRRCMKKDLPLLVQQDREMAQVRGEAKTSPVREENEEGPSLMSSDMQREVLRQKWEKEEEEALTNTSIHYSNVQFDEIRNHGVGFYQFDKSDAKRQEQMDALNKLRDQTVDERSRRERLKEKRKAVLDARLAKVKQRRKLKEGGNLADNTEASKEEEDIGPKLEEMLAGPRREEKVAEEVQPLTRDEDWKKDAPIREWDKGKEKSKLFSEERYMSERRAERMSEFAPPSLYYNTPTASTRSNLKDKQVHSSPERVSEFAPPPVYFDAPSRGTTSNLSDRERQIKSTNKTEACAGATNSVNPVDINISSIPLPQSKRESSSNHAVHQTNVKSNQDLPSVPLPDVSVPPPGFQPHLHPSQPHTAPDYPMYAGAGYGPAIYTPLLPDMSVPPPGVTVPPAGSSTLFAQHVPQSVAQTLTSQKAVAGTQYSLQTNVLTTSASTQSFEDKPRVIVPRAALVDTRLVQNEESDVTSTDVPEINAETYKPGSFTAALQAQHQVAEDAASASRERAHFKGGPVIYTNQQQETSNTQEAEVTTSSGSSQTTEDELTAFLKEIRNSVR